jgi:hypothetical protein
MKNESQNLIEVICNTLKLKIKEIPKYPTIVAVFTSKIIFNLIFFDSPTTFRNKLVITVLIIDFEKKNTKTNIPYISKISLY